MPIQIAERFLHIRRKKNQQVMRNIARLWQIEKEVHSEQELLDRLHPWGEVRDLKFYNGLSFVLGISGCLWLVFGWFLRQYVPFPLCLVVGSFLIFIGYICYEPDYPITGVVKFLEQRMMQLRYGLKFGGAPSHLPAHTQSIYLLSHLKSLFPLFNQGSKSNQIHRYAVTDWQLEDKIIPILLFEYTYVTELTTSDDDGDQVVLKSFEKKLWGAFIFDVPTFGLAISNQHTTFSEPYTERWYSSDIVMNEQLQIYGIDAFNTAKQLSPSLTLKLDDFFKQFKGNLIFHADERIACYLGEQNLFTVQSKKTEIQEISHLRGHLRTLGMLNYEKFKILMLKILS